jgi:hypothetical protein
VEAVVLGPLPQGGGDLVWAPESENGDCRNGSLFVEADGVEVHRYDRPLSNPTLHHGPFGQAALVERCEEAIIGLGFFDGALLQPGQPPTWQHEMLPSKVSDLHDVGWLGRMGLFGGEATLIDDDGSWVDTVVFDPFDLSMTTWAERIGYRASDPLNGIDLVVPGWWTFTPVGPESTATVVTDPTSSSWLTVTAYLDPPPAPTPTVDETLLEVWSVDLSVWDEVGPGRAVPADRFVAVDYLFQAQGGLRTVRQVTVEDRTVEVESFAGQEVAPGVAELLVMVVDSVRILTTVG